MTSWMNDAAAVQNHNGAAFNQLSDPNGGSMLDPSAFMGNSNNSFDPSQFQNQQMQQRMQNGNMRQQSPSFQNPQYQTNPVVPSKRPRPREDSMTASPHQTPGMMPGSRSQTPQQGGYSGFPPSNQGGQQPNQYSHLQQNGSANASPSPVMGNQLRPGAVPGRVATTSPHPFSPAAQQQFAPQASPSHSDHGARTDTPQNQFMQTPNFQPPFNQAFTPPNNRGSVPPTSNMPTPQMQHQQQMQQYPQQQMFPQGGPPPNRQMPPGMNNMSNMDQQAKMYQMRMQQQMQQTNMMKAQRMQNMPPGQGQMNQPPMSQPPMANANGQFPPGNRSQPATGRPGNPREFMHHLTQFMQQRNLPLETNPTVGNKQINIVVLYMAVTKYGGYKKVTASNQWAGIANSLQIDVTQNQNVPQQLRSLYERNLVMFEEAYKQMLMRQNTQNNQVMQGSPGAMQGNPQMSPTKQMNMGPGQMQNPQFMGQPQGPPQMMQPQMAPQQGTPVKQMNQQQPGVNGYVTPGMQPQTNAQTHARNNSSRTIDMSAPNGFQGPMQTPVKGGLQITALPASPAIPEQYEMPTEYDPPSRTVDSYGGFYGLDSALDPLHSLTMELAHLRPNVPSFPEMGTVDIHALTMSLQSGIQAEVRLALDTLATLSVEPRMQLDLKACEDLVESIIDCAEVQVELLAENAAEVSDIMLISSYEDVIRGCRAEKNGLQDVPEFGTLEYELDRSVERLICITTIMRNFSFMEANQLPLADEMVIKFLCTVIRYLGTRNMLLRTNANTLDFMKDIITFLSNLAQAVEIPNKEQALCLLHFLLAFAPAPPPCSGGTDRTIFTSYEPAIHRYLPSAVDSLAKLLARDEPNRTFYKAIFASDIASSPPYDLLTKSFGLAISPIPNHKQDEQRFNLLQLVEARKPHLMQGMLAADILSNLAPGAESNVAKSWLNSEDGFAQTLLHLITVLSSAQPAIPHQGRGGPQQRVGADEDAVLHITISGISVLRRLSEKARNGEATLNVVHDGMLKQENLLGALLLKPPAQPKPEVIKLLCAYAGLDS